MERSSRPLPPVRQGFFHAADGTPLFYEVEGTGKPLILCYGLTCRRDHWRYQRAHFSSQYQIITFDYRGHHASGIPKNDQHLTLQWCGRDVVSLMDHLKLGEAVCLGHSMGVPVVLEAMRLSSRIRAGVFICGGVTDPFARMLHTDRLRYIFKAYSYLHDLAPDLVAFGWRRFTQASGFGYFLTSRLGFNPSKAKQSDVLGYLEGVNATRTNVFLALLSDYAQYDGREFLKALEQPILVIAGEKDFITPFETLEEVASLLKRGELEAIPHGSHNAHMDFPVRINHRISEFLKERGW